MDLQKQNILLQLLNSKKRAAKISTHLYGFSMHQRIKIMLPILFSQKAINALS